MRLLSLMLCSNVKPERLFCFRACTTNSTQMRSILLMNLFHVLFQTHFCWKVRITQCAIISFSLMNWCNVLLQTSELQIGFIAQITRVGFLFPMINNIVFDKFEFCIKCQILTIQTKFSTSRFPNILHPHPPPAEKREKARLGTTSWSGARERPPTVGARRVDSVQEGSGSRAL